MKIRIICLLTIILCGVPHLMAGNRNRTAVDSLLTVGIENSRHGNFEASNKAFKTILEVYKISKKQRTEVLGWLATNAELAGDYQLYFKYLSLKEDRGAHSDDYATAKVLAEQPSEWVSRPHEEVTVRYFIDSLYYEDEYAGCEIRLPVTIGGREEKMIFDNENQTLTFPEISGSYESNMLIVCCRLAK